MLRTPKLCDISGVPVSGVVSALFMGDSLTLNVFTRLGPIPYGRDAETRPGDGSQFVNEG